MKDSAGTSNPPASDENGDGVRAPQPDESGAATLHISYDGAKKARTSIIIIIFILLLLLFPCIASDIFMLHLFGVGGFAAAFLFLFECLITRRITLEPARIAKQSFFLGDTVIPVRWAVVSADQQTITFSHGSKTNFREWITIRRSMISEEAAEEIMMYVKNVYGIPLKRESQDDSEIISLSGTRATSEVWRLGVSGLHL
jgi:hypothetical protein